MTKLDGISLGRRGGMISLYASASRSNPIIHIVSCEIIPPLLLSEMPFDLAVHLLSVLVSCFRTKSLVTNDGRGIYNDDTEFLGTSDVK
jgi:hypothetical protein